MFDPLLEDTKALVSQPADLPEIAETLKGIYNSLYCKENNYGNSGSSPLLLLLILGQLRLTMF